MNLGDNVSKDGCCGISGSEVTAHLVEPYSLKRKTTLVWRMDTWTLLGPMILEISCLLEHMVCLADLLCIQTVSQEGCLVSKLTDSARRREPGEREEEPCQGGSNSRGRYVHTSSL